MEKRIEETLSHGNNIKGSLYGVVFMGFNCGNSLLTIHSRSIVTFQQLKRESFFRITMIDDPPPQEERWWKKEMSQEIEHKLR